MLRRRDQRRLNIGGGEVGTLEQQGCLQGQAIAEAVAKVEGCPLLPLAEAAPAHQPTSAQCTCVSPSGTVVMSAAASRAEVSITMAD
jgi:hypothetical protein